MATNRTKLSIDQESRLIEAVEVRNVLYDKLHDGYRKSKDLNWAAIAEELSVEGFNGDFWQNQWKNLRNQYMAHRRKLKKPSGSAAARRPFYRHEQAMTFLNDSLEEDSTYCNLKVPEAGETIQESVPHDDDAETHRDSDVMADSSDKLELNNSNEHRSHSKQVQRKLDPFDEELISLIKTDKRDEFGSFGELVAVKLRKIAAENKRLAAETQNKINTVIFDAELNLLQE